MARINHYEDETKLQQLDYESRNHPISHGTIGRSERPTMREVPDTEHAIAVTCLVLSRAYHIH